MVSPTFDAPTRRQIPVPVAGTLPYRLNDYRRGRCLSRQQLQEGRYVGLRGVLWTC
jgi:hypothetical protein